ncbi:MAG: FHA domain-containing protein [Alphaproteobacteria bacterium]|nr:FHA domain-containing protein [Alphaproteobacteria bacterium]
MGRARLELVRDGAVVRVITVATDPVHLGRDITNGVVLLDDDVSGHHAIVAPVSGGLEVRDLRSTNGTFVNDERIDGQRSIEDGDSIRLGESVEFRVRVETDPVRATLTLEDETSGTAYIVDDERFTIGSGERCNIRLPDGPARGAVLTVHADGDVWLGLGEEERALADGEAFAVAGHTFRLVPVPTKAPSTLWGCREAKYGYQLQAGTDGSTGVYAVIRDPRTGLEHSLKSENRATLLYVLARKLQQDREAGLPATEAGWHHDEDVLVAVWGRAGLRQAGSNYSVLLHRIRKEIEDAGFDPWFIEKRRGAVRLRLARIELR